jgi:CBS domain-containing protein
VIELADIKTAVLVKDVMTRPVITVLKNDSAETVAKLMDTHDVGSIVVIDDNGKPIGIITERDIVKRVTAKNLMPNQVEAVNVMSRPLVIVGPDEDINQAAEKMSKSVIRRLVVMDQEKMVGIVSSKDIVEITPALIAIISEKTRITQGPTIPRGFITAGYCDRCRQWSEALQEVDGRFLCEECHIEQAEATGETEEQP